MSLALISLTLPSNSLAQITDKNGQPARLYASATGGLISEVGQTSVGVSGALSVYAEDGLTYTVRAYSSSGQLLRTVQNVDPLSDAGDTGNLPPVAGGGNRVRQVATNCRMHHTFSAPNKQSMSRSAHWMRATVSSIAIVWPNFTTVFSAGEAGPGAAATIGASIEYPAGVFTRVTFSGANSGVVGDGQYITSDSITVSIPRGARFWVRTFYTSTAGIIYAGLTTQTFGEGMEYAASGLTDKTMSGTITGDGANLYYPCAIVGNTTQRALGILGDSRVFGIGDTYAGATNDVGEIARSIGTLPYLSYATPSESAYQNTGGGGTVNTARLSKRIELLLLYADACHTQYGINDVQLSAQTAATAYARLQVIWAALTPTIPVYQSTLGPSSTSTDSWATTVNQTTSSGNAQRVLLNNLIRKSVDVHGAIELADVFESARDSGLWKAGLTADGLHANAAGYGLVSSSGQLHPGRYFG